MMLVGLGIRRGRSAVSCDAVHRLVAEEGEASWTEAGGWTLDLPFFPFGGGKLVSFGLRFGPAKTAGDARAALVTQFAGWAGPALHPLGCVPRLDPSAAIARLAAPEAHDMQGMERLYLKSPVAGEEVQRIVAEIYAAPPEIAAKASELMK